MKKVKWYFKKTKIFIDEIPRVDKAIILTLLCMFFCILSLSYLQLKSTPNEIMMEMITTNEPFDFEEILEEQPVTQNTKITTQAFNEADRKLIHSEETFKTLDEILQEKAMAEAAEELLSAQTDASLRAIEKAELKVESLPKNSDDKANKNSLVKFSLEGRNLRGDLPNPIFTCEASGRVVINIKVNRYGEVIETTFNPASSSTSNGCLIENALAYAQQARFNSIAENKEQIGTITYYFQGK